MSIVDCFMESVTATDLAILVVAVLLAIPGMKDIVKGCERCCIYKIVAAGCI